MSSAKGENFTSDVISESGQMLVKAGVQVLDEFMIEVVKITAVGVLIFSGIVAGLSVGIVTGSLLSAITVTVGLVGVGVVPTYFFLRRMSDFGCSS